MNEEGRGTLSVGVFQPMGDDVVGTVDYVGRIVDVTPNRPANELCSLSGVTFPLGSKRDFGIRPGDYIVEATSPSGDILEKHVAVSAHPGSHTVTLGRRLSLPQDLGWQAASGNIDSLLLDEERRAGEEDLPPASASLALIRETPGSKVFGGRPDTAEPVAAARTQTITAAPGAGNFGTVRRRAKRGSLVAMGKRSVDAARNFIASHLGSAGMGFTTNAEAIPAPTVADHGTLPTEVEEGSVGETGEARLRAGTQPVIITLSPGRAEWLLVLRALRGTASLTRLLRGSQDVASPLPLLAHEQGFDIYEAAAPNDDWGDGWAERPQAAYAVIPAPGIGMELVVLPLPWRRAGGERASFEIVASTTGSTFATASTIRDSTVATMLGYVASGRLPEAAVLTRQFESALDLHEAGPLVSVAGAYAARAARADEGAWETWRIRIPQLDALFGWLPDSAILQAWNLLETRGDPDRLEAARSAFIDATHRGVPLFADGVRLLQTGLAACGAPAGDDRDYRRAKSRADALAKLCASKQSFTTLRVEDDS